MFALRCVIAAALLAVAPEAAAQGAAPQSAAAPPAGALPGLIRPLMLSAASGETVGDWQGLEKDRTVTWGAGPVMLPRPSPDGNYFARPGQATVAGRKLLVVASGARAGVMSVYIGDPAPPAGGDAAAAAFRQAGFGVAPARCPVDPRGAAPKRWYRLTAAGKRPAFLAVTPLKSGGEGYTLYLADELPPMSQAEATAYSDGCAGKGGQPDGAASAALPTTGQAGVVAVIEALLRPAPPASVPWASLANLPGVTWKNPKPLKMANPYTDGGADANPRLLEGEFRSATTRMRVLATGDERAAWRFSLMDGANLPRGAVYDGLRLDGFAFTPVRCGKVYSDMSETWFQISGGGKLPAILYRAIHKNDGGPMTESYILRIDNTLPPIQPGQTAPVDRQCPG
jgi:hypothetical protein